MGFCLSLKNEKREREREKEEEEDLVGFHFFDSLRLLRVVSEEK